MLECVTSTLSHGCGMGPRKHCRQHFSRSALPAEELEDSRIVAVEARWSITCGNTRSCESMDECTAHEVIKMLCALDKINKKRSCWSC